MSKISIHTKFQTSPVTLEMVSPRIQQQRIKPEPFESLTASNRIVLQNDDMAVRLYLHDRLSSRKMKRLVKRMQVNEPEAIRLGDPIMAIQCIWPGRGWPHDDLACPFSQLDCLPEPAWLTMQSPRPVRAIDDGWIGAAGVLHFNDAQPGSQPVRLNYDSIIGVTQHGRRVFVTVDSRCQNELVGHAVVDVVDQRATSLLAEALRGRRVKCLKANWLVGRIRLFPHESHCINKNQETFVKQTYVDLAACPGNGKARLLTLARSADPALVNATAARMGCGSSLLSVAGMGSPSASLGRFLHAVATRSSAPRVIGILIEGTAQWKGGQLDTTNLMSTAKISIRSPNETTIDEHALTTRPLAAGDGNGSRSRGPRMAAPPEPVPGS